MAKHIINTAVCLRTALVKIHYLRRPQLRDPSDEMVLETAVNGRAKLLITFNVRDYGNAPARWDRIDDAAGSGRKDKQMKEITTYPLRLPRSLKKAVEKQSEEDGTSINQFVAMAVAEKLSAFAGC